MHRACDALVGLGFSGKMDANVHSSAGNATSTRPSGPKSATIFAPHFVNTMPVHDPVVTKVPAFAPPRRFIKLAKSTSAAIGSRAGPRALSGKGTAIPA